MLTDERAPLRARGISRDSHNGLTLYFDRDPTNDEMRDLHDLLREHSATELSMRLAQLVEALTECEGDVVRLAESQPVAAPEAQWKRDIGWIEPRPAQPVAESRAKPEHVCGLQGYNGMIDPPCPACEANRIALESSDRKFAPIVPRKHPQ